VLAAAEQGSYELIASEDLLEETRDVLERPKMRRYVLESYIPEYIARVRAAARMVLGHFTDGVPSHTSDPDDDYLVELALAADVDVVVSGDPHLLDLGEIRDREADVVVARVLTPSAFLKEVEEG
jgi:predicted nucleic acid-binding protein